MAMQRDYYLVLGISRDETARGIHEAYRQLVKRYHRLTHNVLSEHAPKGERAEALNLELVLSPAEAVRGGEVRIAVPAFRSCPWCGGAGADWLHVCPACDGRGAVAVERPVRISIPSLVRDRTCSRCRWTASASRTSTSDCTSASTPGRSGSRDSAPAPQRAEGLLLARRARPLHPRRLVVCDVARGQE
jgi:DnaJ-class molecular chaperone